MALLTPEGIDLEIILAGLGSRFAAALVDSLIQGAILVALAILGAVSGGGYGLAITVIGSFLVFFGYHVAFEVLRSGRTPGKSLNGIRVVQVSGAPVGFVTSAIRNLLRLVDVLPGTYLVGIVAIVVTARNQRIGDLVAGTAVVRERIGSRPEQALWDSPAPSGGTRERPSTWDASDISPAEVAAVQQFLDRRAGLTLAARQHLGAELARHLRPRVVGADPTMADEPFLESLIATRSGQR
jgi:uncharacterized RDD family membrane protein YckC